MARSSHAACHSFLTVRRVGIVAARRSTALRLTRACLTQSISSGVPGLRSICACGAMVGTGAMSGSVRFLVVVIGFGPLDIGATLHSRSWSYVYLGLQVRGLSRTL